MAIQGSAQLTPVKWTLTSLQVLFFPTSPFASPPHGLSAECKRGPLPRRTRVVKFRYRERDLWEIWTLGSFFRVTRVHDRPLSTEARCLRCSSP
ncbi:hypothetical protein EDB83DRAFT_2419049, partial [Lactarius deliciosus]